MTSPPKLTAESWSPNKPTEPGFWWHKPHPRAPVDILLLWPDGFTVSVMEDESSYSIDGTHWGSQPLWAKATPPPLPGECP